MIDTIQIPALITSPIHFTFVPAKWANALKPYKQAKWDHASNAKTNKNLPPDGYTLKDGDFLAFPQFKMTNGGFYAAHVYAVVKELDCPQVHATLTHEGLTLETVGGEIKTRVTLKPRGISRNSTAHWVELQ